MTKGRKRTGNSFHAQLNTKIFAEGSVAGDERGFCGGNQIKAISQINDEKIYVKQQKIDHTMKQIKVS